MNIRNAYPECVSGMDIRDKYPEEVSGMDIRNKYPESVYGIRIRRKYPVQVPGMCHSAVDMEIACQNAEHVPASVMRYTFSCCAQWGPDNDSMY